MKKNKKIVVIGTVFLDIKGYPEPPFEPTGRNIGRIEYRYGGVARNVAADLAEMGLHPLFVSMTDPKGQGEEIAADLERKGVDLQYLLRQEDSIGTWMVILDPEGEVCANLSKRQNLEPLCSLLLEKGKEIFRDADGILLEMDVDENLAEMVFSLAKAAHTRVYGVISNIHVAMERMRHLVKTDCFVCNRSEAGTLFGISTEQMTSGELLELLDRERRRIGMNQMIVTMDKDGAVYSSDRESGYCPAQPVKLVDSTGAGDSFFAGVSAGLISGFSLSEACQFGSLIAASVITSTENVYCRNGRD
ncbi:MAG: carbohydrate kinase family protein [Parasporobacterium sp.]|nr:carbohydrate kinase family protein [Parasporobacterium sp.]